MSKKYYKNPSRTRSPLPLWEVGEVLEGYVEITDFLELKALHSKRYGCLQTSGLKYYNDFQADLYLNILNQTYTVTQVIALQAYLKELSDQIKEGSWLTAQSTITNLVLSGIFTQVMKDEITSDVNTYVNENY